MDKKHLVDMTGLFLAILIRYHPCFLLGIPCPTPLTSLDRLAKQNSINIYCYGCDEDDVVVPLRLVHLNNDYKTVHLLMLTTSDRQHYCLIKSLSALLCNGRYLRYPTDRVVFHVLTGRKNKLFYCDFCLHGFLEEKRLSAHVQTCNKPQRVEMPKPNSVIEFKNFRKMVPHYVCIYADIG